MHIFYRVDIPIRGTASDVVGIDSATKFRNTVNDRRMVTPANVLVYFIFFIFHGVPDLIAEWRIFHENCMIFSLKVERGF